MAFIVHSNYSRVIGDHIQVTHFVCRRKSPPTGGDFRRQTKCDPCTYDGRTRMEGGKGEVKELTNFADEQY